MNPIATGLRAWLARDESRFASLPWRNVQRNAFVRRRPSDEAENAYAVAQVIADRYDDLGPHGHTHERSRARQVLALLSKRLDEQRPAVGTLGLPPTFVDHGHTGVLVDPDGDLADGIRRAVRLVDRPGRADAAATMVEQRYSIDTMAERLATLYADHAPAHSS